ncbi:MULTISPECIES: hypothetical protein [unclassified Microbacterium]|nr:MULTISPECIES: hypothetical protein [unclassified Microbacterium]
MAAQQIDWVDIPAGTLLRGTPPDEADLVAVGIGFRLATSAV